MKRIIVISGLSGAGKSTALGFFEDLGYFCMDNVPSIMLENLVSLIMNSSVEKSAMVVDVRSEVFGDPSEILRKLKKTLPDVMRIVFLEASNQEIIRRYALTRRKHPLEDETTNVEKAVEKEKNMLGEIKLMADFVIDTSSLNTHTLRERLKKILENLEEETSEFLFRISSFGYKYGIPVDSDYVFDTRFCPNPYYDPKLAKMTGLDEEVVEFFSRYPEIERYVDLMIRILTMAKKSYSREGRNSLSVAVGCTGGRHRSVYISERLAEKLKKLGENVVVEHRDMEKGG